MRKNNGLSRLEKEKRITSAISAYIAKQYSSLRKAAAACKAPYSTVQARMAGRKSRDISHEWRQSLSNAEENTFLRWITRLTRTGYPASPKLAIEMAEEIRRGRIQLSGQSIIIARPIGYSWLERFKMRHPEINSIWTRQLDSARFNAVNYEGVRRWFDAVSELMIEHQYPAHHIYNMDESGFAIGDSQTSRALINIREQSSWKVIAGRQEWITAIECINAAGDAIPPLIIFKAKYTNTAWIPARTPPTWRFSTSNSGWTSDSHGYEWITTVFEPSTRPEDPSARRLLIMDGHSSHITANLIAFCMQSSIDLLILPSHCSHVLQPLDISMFAPLKRALAAETDALCRIDSGRIPRIEWTEMYIRAREKAFTSSNILSGWKGAGLMPLAPMHVLEKLLSSLDTGTAIRRTPSPSRGFDLSLLASSPPDGIELRNANELLLSALDSVEILPDSARRYAKRMTQAYETTHSELIIARRQLSEQQKLLNNRKKHKRGKRVALKGKFVFTTEEVLMIAQTAEKENAARTTKKGSRTRVTEEHSSEDEDMVLENDSEESELDCIIVASRK